MVPKAGLEPARPKAGDFESPASTIPPLGHWHVLTQAFTARPAQKTATTTAKNKLPKIVIYDAGLGLRNLLGGACTKSGKRLTHNQEALFFGGTTE